MQQQQLANRNTLSPLLFIKGTELYCAWRQGIDFTKLGRCAMLILLFQELLERHHQALSFGTPPVGTYYDALDQHMAVGPRISIVFTREE